MEETGTRSVSMRTAASREFPRPGRTTSRKYFEEELLNSYKAGTMTLKEAMSHADSRPNPDAKINFGG